MAAAMLMAIVPLQAQFHATRSAALTGAKNLMVTLQTGVTYYYLVSSNDTQMLHLSADSIRIGHDSFAKARIKAMRFHTLPRLLLNEDSTTFNKAATLDHGLVALRRTMKTGGWNSLVVPFDLTGTQVCEAFGEDAQLVTIRGIGEEDQTVVEFESVDLNTDERALRANYHYLIRPSKEPDISATGGITGFASSRVKGPIYLFPNVSMKTNQSPRVQTLKSSDETTQVRFRGTYVTMDGSGTLNKPLAAGMYTMSEETDEFVQNEEGLVLSAFRSWIQDLSAEPKPLKFYIDGVELTNGIEAIENLASQTEYLPDAVYDLSGRRVLTPKRKGIYIINGKKVIR